MANFSLYYFAWVASSETAFNGSHMREDELIFSFELKHEEGQFAELEIEILNPYAGLLAPGRPLWAWFSWHDGSAVHPLFFGRLVAVPDDLFADIIKLKLVARPLNYAEQRRAVADSLKVLPWYDPIFISDNKLDDPDVVLEGYSALWHVDRFAATVTISDIVNGEEGTVTFTQNDAFYDDLSMKIAGAPLLMCEIEAEVDWTQCDHTGVFEMKTVPNIDTTKAVVTGYSPVSMSVSVKPSSDKPQAPRDETQTTYSYHNKNVTPGPHQDGDLMEEQGSDTVPSYGGDLVKHDEYDQKADPYTGQGEEYSISETYKLVYDYNPPTPDTPSSGGGGGGGGDSGGGGSKSATQKHEVAVEIEQDRIEAMYVAMRADVQPVLASLIEDEKDLIESFTMNARDLVEAGVLTHSAGGYFASARGQQSVEYMLMVARAHLLAGSRVVEIEWECPFNRVIGLSCRKNALIYDDRLPGGAAIGKIVHYEMTGDGDGGEFIGKVTINCVVGNGSPVAAAGGGTPVYVDVGYVDPGYQYYAGDIVISFSGDVIYTPVEFQAVGLQLPISVDQLLMRNEYYDGMSGGAQAQIEGALSQLKNPSFPAGISAYDQAQLYSQLESQTNQVINQVVQDNPSWIELEFKPTKNITVRAEYATDTSQLTLPKQIDLSAP